MVNLNLALPWVEPPLWVVQAEVLQDLPWHFFCSIAPLSVVRDRTQSQSVLARRASAVAATRALPLQAERLCRQVSGLGS